MSKYITVMFPYPSGSGLHCSETNRDTPSKRLKEFYINLFY
jgi:hypothetical protein